MKNVIYASIHELAKYYHVHYNTIGKIVSEMKKRNYGGIVYVGRLPRVDKDRFEQFLTERMVLNEKAKEQRDGAW